MKSTPRISVYRSFRYLLVYAVIIFAAITPATANTFYTNYADSSIEGRWNITIDMAGKEVPSWLEVRHSGLHTLTGEFVGASGSARPVSKVNYTGGKMSFTIPPQWEEGNDVVVEGTLQGNGLSGSITLPDGKNY